MMESIEHRVNGQIVVNQQDANMNKSIMKQ